MRLLIDENVPRSVWEYLGTRGHEVIHVRDRFGTSTPDKVIAKAASEMGAVFVTFNHRHFKALPTLYEGRAALISLRCLEQHARSRLEQHIDRIEWEYERFAAEQSRSMSLEITESALKTHG